MELSPPTPANEYDPSCYLCPGNERANGRRNPRFTDTFVFDNDFGALLPEARGGGVQINPLIRSQDLKGVCRVVCFSPRHDLTLPLMSQAQIRRVVDVWGEQTEELGATYRWVQVFENKGELMGCSNPHPHCQIWASSSLPNEPVKEEKQQRSYRRTHRKVLLRDYLAFELRAHDRVVIESDRWVALVPFWAVWPFEILLMPRRHVLRFTNLNDEEREDLAGMLKRLLTRYDNLFNISFPYTMGWHGAPHDAADNRHWQLHAHFYPPLLRSATVRKFMVGYEMLAEPQRDITAEQAARQLRQLSEIHFSVRTRKPGTPER